MDIETILLSVMAGLAMLVIGLLWSIRHSRKRHPSPIPRYATRRTVRPASTARPRLVETQLDHTIAE